MKLDKVFVIFLSMVFILSNFSFIAYADNELLQFDDDINSGVTPDSMFYFLDVAMDNLRLSFAYDSDEKANIALLIAKERLLEINQMLDENKLVQAKKAQKQHIKVMTLVKDAVVELSDENTIDSVRKGKYIENEINSHSMDMGVIKDVMSSNNDDSSIEQKSDVADFFDGMIEDNIELKTDVNERINSKKPIADVNEKIPVIVVFKEDVAGSSAGGLARVQSDRVSAVLETGGDVEETFHIIPAVTAIMTADEISELQSNPNVAYIERDEEVYALSQSVSWGVKRVGAPTVHSTNKGAGIKVAVVDSGIDYNNPDLKKNYKG